LRILLNLKGFVVAARGARERWTATTPSISQL
jgi:hypothetical protein